MARRTQAEAALPLPLKSDRRLLRFLLVVAGALAAAAVGIFTFMKIENFLIADPRFTLAAPAEPGLPSPHLRIEGLRYASESQVAAVFERDFGRSIYLCPIAVRRSQLLAIDWVKDSSVSRIWPNRMVARIVERTPVAFAQLPSGSGTMRYALVDSDGVLLDPRRASKLNLPVLSGIRREEPAETRRLRVQRFLRLREELGSHTDRISEIDVSDTDNVKITEQFENRAIVLMLGNQKYKQRLDNFLNNVTEIRKRLPQATVLDLRLKDRITAVEGGEVVR